MRAVDHLNRYVSNIDKFIDFYIDVLDYGLTYKMAKIMEFYIKEPDGFEIDLIQWKDKSKFYDNLKNKKMKTILLT